MQFDILFCSLPWSVTLANFRLCIHTNQSHNIVFISWSLVVVGLCLFCSHVQSTLLTYMWVPHTDTHPKSQHCVYQLEFGGGWAMPFLQPCTITHGGHTCGSHTHVLYLCVVFTLVNSESSPSSSTSWSPS